MKAAIVIALVLTTTVFAKADEVKKWLTNVPLTDELDSKIFSAEGHIGSQHYEAVVLGRDLLANPKWSPDMPPPVSVAKIVSNARNELGKDFDPKQMKLASIAFTYLSIVDQWIVVVEFDGTDYTSQSQPEEKQVSYVVLMNGRVISPIAQ